MAELAHPRNLFRATKLALGLATLVLVGTGLLMLPASSTGEPLPFNSACFTAVSALATTGLSVITPGSDLSLFGQLVLMLLMQVGGIGFMTGAVLVFRLLGRRVTLAERLVLRDALGTVSAGSVVRLAGQVTLGVLIIEAVGALLLCWNWTGQFGVVRAVYLGIWHSVSAFTNTGFDLFSVTPVSPAGFPLDTLTLLILSSLVVLGGLGIPVLADVMAWLRAQIGGKRHRFSLHTRITVVTVGALLLLGTLALFLGSASPDAVFGHYPWPVRLLLSYFHAVTARTAGFLLVPFDHMSGANTLVLCILMFVGGSPASMSGGIGTSTLIVLTMTLVATIRGREMPEVWGRTIPGETIFKATAILFSSLAFVLGVTWLLLLTQKATLDQALFEAVSAFATCGFTLGLTPHLNGFGQLLIAFTMFAGRLGILTLVVALTAQARPAPLSYPTEKILIG